MHTIEITGSFPYGSNGSDHDRQNPLSRSLDRLLRTGKPPGKITNCYLVDDVGIWRWFGVLGFSEGDRVLFYPGFSGCYDQTSSYVRDEKGLQDRGSKSIQIDHVSLEKDLQSTHFTSAQSKQHLGSFSTLSLNEGRYLWFGLSVRCTEVLRPLMKDTRAVATGPAIDSKRRVEEFEKSILGQVFQGLEFPPGVCVQPGFAHFSVIVGSRGFADYTGADLRSRALTPSWCSRNRCRSCRMLSSRFAGIPISSSTIDGPGVPQLANRGEQTTLAVPGSGGRLHFKMVAGIKSERRPTSNRNAWPECIGIRSRRAQRALEPCSCGGPNRASPRNPRACR